MTTSSLYSPTTALRTFGDSLVRLPAFFVHAVVVLTCVVVAALATIDPPLAVAALFGLALVPIVLARPIVGLCALLLMSFLEYYAGLTGTLSVTKILGIVLLVAWIGFVATTSHAERRAEGLLGREPILAAALILLAAWVVASALWAIVPAAAQTSAQRFVLNFMLFPIALVAVRARSHIVWLMVTFVVGAFAAAGLGLVEGSLTDPASEDRLKGAGINPNQLGSYLVVAMVLCGAFAANRRWSPSARSLAIVAAGLAGIGIFLTLSRGALTGMCIALVLAPLAAGRGRRGAALALAATATIGAVLWFAAVAPADAVDRVTNPAASGGSGRTDLWRVGWRMVEDQPIRGVGAGNFPEASIRYLLRPGATERDEFIVDEKKVAHNIYLTVVSELGFVGLFLFLLVIALCLRSALRAAHLFERQGDRAMELTSRALFISIASLAAVGFFSSALYVKQFWLLLAVAPAVLAMAERGRRQEG